jgi:hypothetical protein
MSFTTIVNTALTNLGVGFEWLLILLGTLGALIFAAKDFKLMLIVLMTTMAGLFIWFYEINYNYVLPLTLFFMAFVLLCLSLFAVSRTSKTGGFT